MKPLGKAIKVAFDTNKPVAIDDLLTDYRSTPHPGTGLTPGDMVLQGGYHSKLPKKTPPTYSQIEEAKGRDKEWKTKVNAKKMPLAGESTHILSREKMPLLCVLKLEGNFIHCMNQPLTL